MYRCVVGAEDRLQLASGRAKTDMQKELHIWSALYKVLDTYAEQLGEIEFDGGSISYTVYFGRCNDILSARLKCVLPAAVDKHRQNLTLNHAVAKLCKTLDANIVKMGKLKAKIDVKTKRKFAATTEDLKHKLDEWKAVCRDLDRTAAPVTEYSCAAFVDQIDSVLVLDMH